MSLTGHATSALRTEARSTKTSRALRDAEPTEACSTSCGAWSAKHPPDRNPVDARDASFAHAPRPKSRLVCSARFVAPRGRNHATLAGPPHQLARPKPTLVDGARSAGRLANRSPRAFARSVPAKPPAQVSLDRTQPARSTFAPEGAPVHLCRIASRSSARAADPMRRSAVPFSAHASTRDARLADRSSDESLGLAVRGPRVRPRSLSEDCALVRRRANQNESDSLRITRSPAHDRLSLDRSRASSGRRSVPVDCRDAPSSRRSPTRAHPPAETG